VALGGAGIAWEHRSGDGTNTKLHVWVFLPHFAVAPQLYFGVLKINF
jgi:hypothetical protein